MTLQELNDFSDGMCRKLKEYLTGTERLMVIGNLWLSCLRMLETYDEQAEQEIAAHRKVAMDIVQGAVNLHEAEATEGLPRFICR